jgi:squalene-hopene/tetraprenyl-beta-curcumene cyclase
MRVAALRNFFMQRKFFFSILFASLFGAVTLPQLRAADEAPQATLQKFDSKQYQDCVKGGMNYLLTKGLQPDGSYATSPQSSPALTALCVTSLLRSGLSPDDPSTAKSLKYLEGFIQSDGGIYKKDSLIQNYETSIGIMCFAEANKDGRYTNAIKAADKFVKSIQWGGDGGIDQSAVNYGGAGYGRSKTRPDLSNTSFLLDALQAAGDSSEDEAVKRALIFVSRCQNLQTEYNTTPFAGKVNDGGFYYTPSDGGQSAPGGTTEDGGIRSYGSMTYAGLKSMIYCGLKKDDKRVAAAVDWIKKNYDVTSNPGMGQKGVFYGYHTFAKALKALGGDTFTDAKGVVHPWKVELVSELAKRQREDGSWVNSDKTFMEGDPNLVTAYVLLTLSQVKPSDSK